MVMWDQQDCVGTQSLSVRGDVEGKSGEALGGEFSRLLSLFTRRSLGRRSERSEEGGGSVKQSPGGAGAEVLV